MIRGFNRTISIKCGDEIFNQLHNDGCFIAIDKQYMVDKLEYANKKNYFSNNPNSSNQFLIKNPKFSNCKFKLSIINNIHIGKIYTLSDIDGDGHITITQGITNGKLALNIKVGSFYSPKKDVFIDPSDELILYYKEMKGKYFT